MKTPNDPRHLGRRFALQILFASDINSRLPERNNQLRDYTISLFDQWRNLYPREDQASPQPNFNLARRIVERVAKEQKSFDQTIQESAPEWPLDQISVVDLTILRMALAELTDPDSPPHKVVIDEAVELGKEFGGENSSKFINGVLGTVVNELNLEDKNRNKNDKEKRQ